MQNKDDSHRPCFALFRRVGTLFAAQFKDIRSRHLRATLTEGGKLLRRVGTLLAVQLKDVLSRHLRATLPEGESFFSRHLRATLPEGESNKKMLVIIKRLRFYLLIEAQPLFVLSFLQPRF